MKVKRKHVISMTERPQAFAFAIRLQNTKQQKNSSERSIYFGRNSKPSISRGKCIRGIRVVKWTYRTIKLNRNDYSNECVTYNTLYGNSLVNSRLTNSVGVRSFGAFFSVLSLCSFTQIVFNALYSCVGVPVHCARV